jgi:hypothetical protein
MKWILMASVIALLPMTAMAEEGPMTDASPRPTSEEFFSPAFEHRVAPLLRAEHVKPADADQALGSAEAYCLDKHSATFRAALHGALHDPEYIVPETAAPEPKKNGPRSAMLMTSNKSLAYGIWFAEAAQTCGLRSPQWAQQVKLAMLFQVGVIADRLYPKMHDSDTEYTLHADALQRAWDAQDAMEAKGKHATPADCKRVLDSSDMFVMLDKFGNAK